MNKKSEKYEENFRILETITDSLNKDEVQVDDLVEKTREALNAARNCMEILKTQKGEFKKLETEFSVLLDEAKGDPESKSSSDNDDPF
jgi:exonuclease VII small subunit